MVRLRLTTGLALRPLLSLTKHRPELVEEGLSKGLAVQAEQVGMI